MPNLQLYTVSFIRRNGRLMSEHVEATVTRNSNASVVRTMGKGFSGVSPGAPDCEIDVTSAVPAADFEYDPGSDMFDNEVIEIGITGPGGKTAVSKGFIMSDTFSQGVGKEASLSFKFMGQWPQWEG